MTKAFWLVAILFASIAHAGPGKGDIGPGSGGGGDSYSLEFLSIGKMIVAEMRKKESLRAAISVAPEALETVIFKTHVRTKDDLWLGGREVDAINYPARGYIELSRSRWPRLRAMLGHQASLVLHEYLAMMDIKDTSTGIAEKFKQWQSDNGFPFEVLPDKLLTTPKLYRVTKVVSFSKTDSTEKHQVELKCAAGDTVLMGTFALPLSERLGYGIIKNEKFYYGIRNCGPFGYWDESDNRIEGWRCGLVPKEAFSSGTAVDQKKLTQIDYQMEILCQVNQQ